jgi:hypothetical protein
VQVQPGGAIVNPATGQVIYRNEEMKPGFTSVAPGATIIGSDGKPVFTAPASAADSKPPSGYEWIDPNDKSKGMAAIAGGPATAGLGEIAGKLALMKTARDGIRASRKVLEEPWGLTGAAQNSVANLLPSAAGAIGEAQRNVRAGVEAALRVMTGAAAPESEVVRYENMFTPNTRDSGATAKQKLDMLERFMDEAEAYARQGRQTRDERAAPKPGGPPNAGGSGADPLGIR